MTEPRQNDLQKEVTTDQAGGGKPAEPSSPDTVPYRDDPTDPPLPLVAGHGAAQGLSTSPPGPSAVGCHGELGRMATRFATVSLDPFNACGRDRISPTSTDQS